MDPSSSGKRGHSEVIYGVRVTLETIDFFVATGGCTKKEHFSVDVHNEGLQSSISLLRVVSDDCKGNMDPVTISFTKEELGLTGIRHYLTNAIGNVSQHRVDPS